MLDWKGVFPALTTPFTANDELDLPMFKKNLQAQLHAGVHGVVVGGSLGEASVLTVQEKETLVKFAIENIKGKLPVVLNIAESATKEALKQIQQVKIWRAKQMIG
jgi:4-hydroxy-tetrahydrodipicolinate synthase